VRAIDWRGDHVHMRIVRRGHEDEITARRAIVTLPLGVLQRGAVTFMPGLGDHADAIAQLAMGQVVKVVLTLRFAVWKDELDEPISFLHQPGATFPTCWIRERAGSHHVIAWAGGPAARALARCSHDEIIGRAIATFASFIDAPVPRVASAVRAAYTYDYAADPYARGAYSYARPGGLAAPGVLERPLGDRLFFAGEATSGPYEGTVTARWPAALARRPGPPAARGVIPSGSEDDGSHRFSLGPHGQDGRRGGRRRPGRPSSAARRPRWSRCSPRAPTITRPSTGRFANGCQRAPG